MARSPNCTGAPLYKGRVDVSISYPDPDETLLETPVELPTSEPASPQVSFTLASGHMPVWSPYELPHSKTAILYVSGKSTTATTVYYRAMKNGESIATGSLSNNASTYYTQQHYRFKGVDVGDVVSCKLWAANTGTNITYDAFVVYPTDIAPGIVCAGISVLASLKPTLTKGSPYGGAGAKSKLQHCDTLTADVSSTQNCMLLFGGASSGFLRVGYGDILIDTSTMSFSTYYPRYFTCYIPTRISYTPLNLRV